MGRRLETGQRTWLPRTPHRATILRPGNLRCEALLCWFYKIVLSSLNRQAGDKMHSSRLHAREGPTAPASLRPGPLSSCPNARAGALSRSPGSLYLLACRVRHAGFTDCARSSTDRVADFESEGCRFESYRARLTQLLPNTRDGRTRLFGAAYSPPQAGSLSEVKAVQWSPEPENSVVSPLCLRPGFSAPRVVGDPGHGPDPGAMGRAV